MTLVATKTVVVSCLNSTFRYFPGHINFTGKLTTSIFS
jgi:hypothetical protein